MPLIKEDFDDDFKNVWMFDAKMGGHCFSQPVLNELARLDDRHQHDVKILSKEFSTILKAFTESKLDSKDPQKAAKEIFDQLNAIPSSAALANLKKILIQNIYDSFGKEDWGYKHEAESTSRYDKFRSALSQLIFPPQPRSALYPPPLIGEHKELKAPLFDIAEGELLREAPLRTRSADEIKKAVGELTRAIAHQLPSVTSRVHTDKTWDLTIENKNIPSTVIRCIEDKKLTVENINPKNDKQMDAYVESIKTMAVGRGIALKALVIRIDDPKLDKDMAVALFQAAQRKGVKTNVTLKELGLEHHVTTDKNITLATDDAPTLGRRPR